MPDETAAEFFRRHAREALACGLTFIDAYLRLRPGHLVELVGPAGAAKTELLIQVGVGVLCRAAAVDAQLLRWWAGVRGSCQTEQHAQTTI